MLDLIISGGLVVTPAGVGRWQVGVKDGKIATMSEPNAVTVDAMRIVDASGKIVVPGGIEPHAHIGSPSQPERSGADEVTRAAIYGGTTTVFDFATQRPGLDLLKALEEAEERWRGKAYTDYSYHPIFTEGASSDAIAQIPELIESGFPSLKVFTTCIRPPSESAPIPKYHTDFGRLGTIMELTAAYGGLLMVHGEDDEMVRYNYSMAKARGQWEWWNMHLIHTNLSEELSFWRVLRLAERRSAAIYFVHISARESLDTVGEVRSRGLPVYGETIHNYLCFTADNYREPHGMKYHTYPSLKSEEDRQALWAGLLDGRISTIATDHASTSWEMKTKFKTVADATGGHNGIETRLGIVYTEGVVKRGMSLERFVDITSANAAKIFGLYPIKGAIAVGSDADITIIDPSMKKQLSLKDLHLQDYSIWEGWEICGWPVTTILRGKIMVEDRKLLADPSYGRLVHRKISPAVLRRPVC